MGLVEEPEPGGQVGQGLVGARVQGGHRVVQAVARDDPLGGDADVPRELPLEGALAAPGLGGSVLAQTRGG